MGVMTPAQKAAEYYRFAYTCEEQKAKGCPGLCANCQLNVSLYLEDPREAVLIKSSAQIDYAKAIDRQHEKNNSSLYTTIWVILGIIFLVWRCSPDKPKPKPVVEAKQEVIETHREYELPTQWVDDDDAQIIRQAINSVKKYEYGTDYNGDGLFNCIDAAVGFYHAAAKDMRQVLIIENNNPYTGMNHLFNAVRVDPDDSLLYIEPQKVGDGTKFTMREVWGSRYDPIYNIDKTQYWIDQFINK